jgi:hypothetical protein
MAAIQFETDEQRFAYAESEFTLINYPSFI